MAIKVRLVRIALFLFCASLGQSCSTLHEVPRQPDWPVFTEVFGAAPAQNMTCYLSGKFFEVGERFSHDFEVGASRSMEEYELLSIFSERFTLVNDFAGIGELGGIYTAGSIFLDFRGEQAVVAFSHRTISEKFVGAKLLVEREDFSCVDGVIYLKDIRNRSGAEGVDHSKNAVTALRLSKGGDLLVYHAQSPAPRGYTSRGLARSYYYLKRVNP